MKLLLNKKVKITSGWPPSNIGKEGYISEIIDIPSYNGKATYYLISSSEGLLGGYQIEDLEVLEAA